MHLPPMLHNHILLIIFINIVSLRSNNNSIHFNNNHINNMNKLQLPQAKLFYIVGEAYRKRMID